jgi:membrane protein YqaA with SNARE-associated domain
MPEWLASLHSQATATPLGLISVSFVVCFVSGFLPLVNAEAYLLSVSALSPARVAVPLTVAGALGQMLAKALLYLSGRGIVRVPLGRHGDRVKQKMAQARAQLEKHSRHTGSLLFASAFLGLPPFYFVSIIAGTLRLPFGLFFGAGLVGRVLRFGIFVFLPQVARLWL